MNKANFYIYVNGKEFIVEKNTTLIKLIKDLNLEKNLLRLQLIVKL